MRVPLRAATGKRFAPVTTLERRERDAQLSPVPCPCAEAHGYLRASLRDAGRRTTSARNPETTWPFFTYPFLRPGSCACSKLGAVWFSRNGELALSGGEEMFDDSRGGRAAPGQGEIPPEARPGERAPENAFDSFHLLEVGQDAYAQANGDEAEHIGWIAAHFLDDARAETGVRALAKKLIVKLGPRFPGAKDKILAAQLAEFESSLPG